VELEGSVRAARVDRVGPPSESSRDIARDTATGCSRRVARLNDAPRFENHVDRCGEHHLWTGSTNPLGGTDRLQVDGKQTTAHGRAWALVVGSLKPDEVVLPYPVAPLCIRVEPSRLAKPKIPRRRSNASSATSKRVQVQVRSACASPRQRRSSGSRGHAGAAPRDAAACRND
jgi:hypothetical protein